MSIPLQFASLCDGQEDFVWSSCLLDLSTDFLVGNMVLYEMHGILQYHLISMACILLRSSALRVHGSQAYMKMDQISEKYHNT